MGAEILYCGDTSLTGAAAYLAGVLTHAGLPYRYVPSHQPLAASDVGQDLRLLILSDFPADRIPSPLQQRLAKLIDNGIGLLMIGGWESYHGQGGNWDGTPLGDLLPVEIADDDDRLNSDRPLLVRRVGVHPITEGLPWELHAPFVGGLNRFQPRVNGRVLLAADSLAVDRNGGAWRLTVGAEHPLLVVGEAGRGRTAALATDVAPHWVGGLVDWGPGRVMAHADGADAVEVGDLYAQFFKQLILWTKG